MSRGFGVLQRAILALCPSIQGRDVGYSPLFYDATGRRYKAETVIDVRLLKRQLPQPRGAGFDAAFSRAVRTLVARGALVPVTIRLDPPHGLYWPRRRLYVVQAPMRVST